MNDDSPVPTPIHTRIWLEEPEPDNPFATQAAYCHGYNVYGEMLGKATWADIFYLLFRGEAPNAQQARVLENLAVALANPGPRDAAVHAAMSGGVGGSTSASCLMAALAVGAGQYGGSREVYLVMQTWQHCATNLEAWQACFKQKPDTNSNSIWPPIEHTPGFDPYATNPATIVQQTLNCLANQLPDTSCLKWLHTHQTTIQNAAQAPLAMTAIAATAFTDLGFTPEQGEMIYLLLRLPGAAAHALEQKQYGHKRFPFFDLDLKNDPGPTNENNE